MPTRAHACPGHGGNCMPTRDPCATQPRAYGTGGHGGTLQQAGLGHPLFKAGCAPPIWARYAMRPDQRADERQRTSVRAELHDLVDFVVDHWTTVDRQAREMGRGYVSAQGPSGSGGSSDPTATVALSDALDPAELAMEVQAERAEFIGHARRLGWRIRRLLPMTEAEVPRGRVNTVEVCVECGDPAPQVKRLDNEPYHEGRCWWAAYRRKREV